MWGATANGSKNRLTGYVAEAPVAKYVSAALERAWSKRDQWKAQGVAAHERAKQLWSTIPVRRSSISSYPFPRRSYLASPLDKSDARSPDGGVVPFFGGTLATLIPSFVIVYPRT